MVQYADTDTTQMLLGAGYKGEDAVERGDALSGARCSTGMQCRFFYSFF